MIYSLRPVRSFVRRNGRMTPLQKESFEALWQTYGVALPSEGMLHLSSLFPMRNAEKVVLEIGFGMGHSLLAMAEQFPDTHFLGVEVHRPGIGAVLNGIHAKQLKNIRVMCEDVLSVLQYIPENTLDAVLIFFPDPWPKKRHHKRRLIQPSFIALISQKLKIGGYIHIATDWENYAKHIAEVLAEFPQLIEATDANLSDMRIMPRITTKFEQRGKKLGHEVFEFVRCSDLLHRARANSSKLTSRYCASCVSAMPTSSGEGHW